MRRRNGRPGLIGTMARTAVIAVTATAVSGNVQQAAEFAAMQQQVAALRSQPPAPVAPVAPSAPPPPPGAGDLMAQLS